ncbi:MAG: hypothetical protein ACE5HV_12775 [Acidobacteriota bacterium]
MRASRYKGPESLVGKTLGHYEILELLGAGGMGEVYLAEDTRLVRKVAIKVLPAEFASDPERLARFEREARAAAALNHPYIAVVHDVGFEPGGRRSGRRGPGGRRRGDDRHPFHSAGVSGGAKPAGAAQEWGVAAR